SLDWGRIRVGQQAHCASTDLILKLRGRAPIYYVIIWKFSRPCTMRTRFSNVCAETCSRCLDQALDWLCSCAMLGVTLVGWEASCGRSPVTGRRFEGVFGGSSSSVSRVIHVLFTLSFTQ